MENLIQLNSKNTPITTSLKIASVFNKRHADVIRSIKQTYIPKEFNERNFALVDYVDEKGEKRPMYEMTKDGFVLLAMGFNGKRAMEFKIAYINAFNEMEKYIRESAKVLTSPDLALVGGTVKRCVKSAIRELLEDKGEDSWEVSDNDLLNCLYRWSATKHRGTTQTIREINAENTRMKEQLAYIQQAFK